MMLMNQSSLPARSFARPRTAASVCFAALLAPAAHAGISPGGLVSDAHVTMARSRAIMINNNSPITRTRGAELESFGQSGGSGHTNSPGFWYMGDSFWATNYHENDVFEHRATGLLELSDLRDNDRMQGLATQSMMSNAEIVGPAAYDLTISLVFDQAHFVGEVDATFQYNAFIAIFGGGPPSIISESDLIDITKTSDGFLFTTSGILNENGGSASVSMNLDTTLSSIIDASGELSEVGYVMTTTFALRAIPAPSAALALTLGLGLGLGTTRRRR